MLHQFPKVSIILLNYKGAKDTIECLKSLQNISYDNYNIVIVDNASPDDSVQVIENYMVEKYKDTYEFFDSPDTAMKSVTCKPYTLIQSGYNGGYGHGNNIGIKFALATGAEYVLILNNDTVVDSGFLEPMVEMCENDPSIGISSAKIYFYDRPDVFWFHGGKVHTCTGKVEHFHFNQKDIGQKIPDDITFITGCTWLLPKQVFETVGFINESYFMYVEDLEYCSRVTDSGFKLKVSDKSFLMHKVGASTGGKLSSFSTYWRTKNMNTFILSRRAALACKIFSFLIFNTQTVFLLLKNSRFDLINIYLRALTEKDYNVA